MTVEQRLEPEDATILAADWVVPDSQTEIRDGQVRIASGCVTHVGTDLSARFPGEPVLEFPGCALIPGLVNAHTHLELTLLRGFARGLPFPEWIGAITTEIQSRDESFFCEGARAGALEVLRGGVTSVADYSTFGFSPDAIMGAGLSGIAFREIFCPNPDGDYSQEMNVLADWMGVNSSPVARGYSAHAPYNAAKPHVTELIRRFPHYPRSIHVAEGADEVSYVLKGRGDMAERHRARGFTVEPRRMSPVEYMDNCSYWGAGSIAVHLTQASHGDLAVLKARGVAAVFCPVSNAVLGVGVPPVAIALRTGLKCGLGTDSAISSERMDMFEEMRAVVLTSRLRSDPVTEKEAFHMATAGGAAAIGQDGVGTLAPGMRADLTLVQLARPAPRSVVETIVWQAVSSDVRSVWCAGRRTYSD